VCIFCCLVVTDIWFLTNIIFLVVGIISSSGSFFVFNQSQNSALACLDIYPNINRVRKSKCPVMIIHGRLDEEVPITQGMGMYEATPDHHKRDPWWVPDRGQNDITEGPGKLAEYVGRLRIFLASLD
jgi:fermentation-respiration switch protein FrsA (DUF1100 family)